MRCAPDVMCSHKGAFVLAVTQQALRVKGRVTGGRDKRFEIESFNASVSIGTVIWSLRSD